MNRAMRIEAADVEGRIARRSGRRPQSLVARLISLAPLAPLALLTLLGLSAAGCAPLPGTLEPLPRHPFPRWVEQLEPGKTDRAGVEQRFGEPDAVEQSVRGGLVYRYRFAEVAWPDDDPDRPVVGANGKVGRRPNTKLEDVGNSIEAFGDWLDWLMFYPPRQPRPVAKRWLPATIHDLELAFDPEGRLVRYRYAPEPGRAPITPRS